MTQEKTEELADKIFDVLGEHGEGADIKRALIYNLMDEIMEDVDPLEALKFTADEMREIFEYALLQKKRAMH